MMTRIGQRSNLLAAPRRFLDLAVVLQSTAVDMPPPVQTTLRARRM
jgi:hypothetical protein